VTIDRTNEGNSPAPGLPAQPTLLAPVAEDTQVSLSWTNVGTVLGYRVYYGTSSTTLNSNKDAGNNTETIIPNLTNNTTYYFAVAAYNEAGEGTRSTIESATPHGPPPGQPQNVQAAPGVGAVSLTWDAVATATEYKIEYGTNSANLDQSVTGITQTSKNVTPLAYDTLFYFKVFAKNANGYGIGSTLVSATTQHPPAPPTPILNNPVPGDALVNLSWSSSSGATGYKLEYRPTSGGTWTVGYDGPNLIHTQTPLINGTSYDFQVSAYNQWEISAPSTPPKSATPSAAPAQITLDATTNVTTTNKLTHSLSHTVSTTGTNRALVVTITLYDFSTIPQSNSVTYGGQAMTLVDRQTISTTFNKAAVEMWYLLNPPTVINTIQANFNTTVDNLTMGGISLKGVKQAAPEAQVKSWGDSLLATVSLNTTTANAWVIDALYYDASTSSVSFGSGQTQRYKNSTGGDTHASSYKSDSPAGAISMQWTKTSGFAEEWALMAAAFVPAIGGAMLERERDIRLADISTDPIPLVGRDPNPSHPGRGKVATWPLFLRFLDTLFGVREAEAAQLDLTTFTENDPQSQITRTVDCETYTNVETTATPADVFKSYTTPTGDFTFEFDARITAASSILDDMALWGITNTSSVTYNTWGAGAYVGVDNATSGFKMVIKTIGETASTSSATLSFSQRYYFRVKRVGTNLIAEVYSDSARAQLVSSLTKAFNANAFSYLYAFSVKGNSPFFTGRAITGDMCHMNDSGSQTPPPSVPVLVSVTPGQGTAYVDWNTSTNAATYTVHYGTISGNYPNIIAGITATDQIVGSLTNGTQYFFAVSAQGPDVVLFQGQGIQ